MVRSAFYRMYLPIALLSFPLAGMAQGTYQVTYWGYEDGLPTQTVISDILQSPEGYLWLSTPSGIIRFDGIDFRLLDKTNSRLEANSILTFFKDSEKRWWYGTADKGFGAFSQDTTLTFPRPGYVTTFAEMPQGTLWIGTNGNGLWKIDLEAYRLIPQRVFPDKVGLYIDELSVGPSNELYIASGKGLFTIQKDSIIAHPATQGISILSVWASPDGSVWYSTEEGLHQLKNKHSRHIAFPSQPKRSLIQQVKGYRGGVLALTDYALYLYQEGIMKSIFETDNKVLVSMETDHEGGIWLGTEVNGLIRLTPAVISMLGEENGLAGKIATVITQSREGTIYIGTTSGLTILDADSSAVQTLFEGSLVTSVLADQGNRIWVALRGQGIRLLEGTNVRSFTAEEEWLSTAIWTLYEDEGGRIWAGSPMGVSTYSTEYGWQANNAVNEKLLHKDVRAIYRSQSGALWIGTSYGLHAFRKDTVHVYATEHGLKSAVILDIAETNDSTLWIATKDGGLHRFKEGGIKSVPESLTGPKISRIIPVGEYLWLAGGTTIIGIKNSALNKWLDQEEHLTMPDHIRFGQDDGLEGEVMGTIQPSGRQMKNGELWLPTSRGVATFKPDAENLRLPPPPVTINYMIIGTDTLTNPSALKIPHTRNRIDISYTGFSFTNPEAVSYFYRMADFDQQWNQVGNRRMAIYTGLPPGDYQFEVKAQIGDGLFSSETASVSVTIIPAFYETVWFRAAVVITILLILWMGYTYRINAIKRLERLRVRIANDLHDEIASNLGSIVLRSRLLIQNKSLAGEQQQHLTEIDRMSRRTAVSMRDIIWLINPDKDRVDDLQSKLKQVTGQLLVDISFEFNTKHDGKQQEISLKVRRNTVFIYKEILHNIVKHADASSVKIDFSNHQKEINLMVKDDGKGFNTDGLTDDGIGLKSIQKRADDINARLQINSSPGKGTCVSIIIPIT